MLYTLSQAHYERDDLHQLLNQLTEDDVVVLWQDGVLQAVKYPKIFTNAHTVYALQNDVIARGLTVTIPTISLAEFVTISQEVFPQIAL